MSDATDAIVQKTDGPPGPGHNIKGEEVVWERWTKKRVFVRALRCWAAGGRPRSDPVSPERLARSG